MPAAAYSGYDLAASDGGIFTFGTLPFCGSTGGIRLNAPVVGMAMAPGTGGYWEVASDGGIFAFGGARFYGSMGGKHLNAPDRGHGRHARRQGLLAGGLRRRHLRLRRRPLLRLDGRTAPQQPIVGMSSSTDGSGYRLVASDGGIFTFGDAPFSGSDGRRTASTSRWWARPTTPIPAATGRWPPTAACSPSAGPRSTARPAAIHLNAPIVGMAETSNGSGYRFAAADGGVFSFSAPFFGSMGGTSGWPARSWAWPAPDRRRAA